MLVSGETFLPLAGFATSSLKMEAVCFSETLETTDKSTRRQNPEEHHDFQHRKTLKYQSNSVPLRHCRSTYNQLMFRKKC
jgi:hypothetical protein